jgi:hypothetical protein
MKTAVIMNTLELLYSGAGIVGCMPGPVGEVISGALGVRVLQAKDPLAH